MAENFSQDELMVLLRELVELHRREIGLREEFGRLTREKSEQTLIESKQRLSELRKESDQKQEEQKEFRNHVLQELAKHSELLSQILNRISLSAQTDS